MQLFGHTMLRHRWLTERPPTSSDGADIRKWLEGIPVSIPEDLLAAKARSHEMADDFAEVLVEAVNKTQQFNHWVEGALEGPNESVAQNWPLAMPCLISDTRRACDAASKAIDLTRLGKA